MAPQHLPEITIKRAGEFGAQRARIVRVALETVSLEMQNYLMGNSLLSCISCSAGMHRHRGADEVPRST
jgi:hypothetical protein